MKAMDLIPYEVWRQRSYFDMESMLLVDVPTQQWMDEFYQVGGRGTSVEAVFILWLGVDAVDLHAYWYVSQFPTPFLTAGIFLCRR